MKQVTRNIDPESASDLLERVPCACISFACEQGPHAQPVSLIWRDKRYFVGIPTQATYKPNAEQEVVLLVDEGIHYYDLRALYIRGTVQPVEPPGGAPDHNLWFEVIPTKVVAWDYGMMREVDDAS